MNRKEAAELLPIIKAFCEGKQIQFLFDEWKIVMERLTKAMDKYLAEAIAEWDKEKAAGSDSRKVRN